MDFHTYNVGCFNYLLRGLLNKFPICRFCEENCYINVVYQFFKTKISF